MMKACVNMVRFHPGATLLRRRYAGPELDAQAFLSQLSVWPHSLFRATTRLNRVGFAQQMAEVSKIAMTKAFVEQLVGDFDILM